MVPNVTKGKIRKYQNQKHQEQVGGLFQIETFYLNLNNGVKKKKSFKQKPNL